MAGLHPAAEVVQFASPRSRAYIDDDDAKQIAAAVLTWAYTNAPPSPTSDDTCRWLRNAANAARRGRRQRGAVRDSELLTIPAVAELAGVCRLTIYRYIHAGDLKAVNIAQGKQRTKLRIRGSAYQEFMKAREV